MQRQTLISQSSRHAIVNGTFKLLVVFCVKLSFQKAFFLHLIILMHRVAVSLNILAFGCIEVQSNGYHIRHFYRGDVFLTHKDGLQYGLKSIRYMGAKMWNDLPEEIRNSSSKCSFKKHLKKHILSSL